MHLKSEKIKYLSPKDANLLPQTTGIYAFKSKKAVLYIGKAVNIRERVKNHFQQPGFKDVVFINQADRIGYIKTDSEIEALLLEAELIKKHQPKFNVLWKDDKNYFYVVITKEDFSRVFLTHQLSEVQPQIIGPFVDGRALKQTLRVLRKVFPYRTCRTIPKRPCLYYDLDLCLAPCKNKLSLFRHDRDETGTKDYGENVKNLVKVLQGKKIQVLRNLKKEMGEMSKSQNFERAAKLRDQIMALENVFQNAHILQELPKRKMNWQEIEKQLRKILSAQNKIKRIEGYDVSNIQGQQATGAMVVFENGIPARKEYRKFRIKISGKPDDIAMLKEVLSRRLKHPEWPLPQVMLIDGGKAQLNAALKAKNDISKFQNIRIIALAKRKNELYIEGKKKPILLKNLPQDISDLILHLRDEAHRFAIKYHKGLRRKSLFDFQIKS